MAIGITFVHKNSARQLLRLNPTMISGCISEFADRRIQFAVGEFAANSIRRRRIGEHRRFRVDPAARVRPPACRVDIICIRAHSRFESIADDHFRRIRMHFLKLFFRP